MIPSRAIIVYENNKNYDKDYFLETRDIRNVGGKYMFMAPVPLASNILRDIAASMKKNDTKEMTTGGLIASHLLYGSYKPGKTIVVWYRPAMDRTLNFSASLKIKGSTTVKIPATLYVVIDDKLYLYALMTSERPAGNCKLYNAPFFNIYDTGNVCLGSAKVGKQQATTFELEAERFERAFYMAEQTHTATSQGCKTPLAPLWNQLIKKKIPFPSKTELIQHKKYKTFGELIDKLID